MQNITLATGHQYPIKRGNGDLEVITITDINHEVGTCKYIVIHGGDNSGKVNHTEAGWIRTMVQRAYDEINDRLPHMPATANLTQYRGLLDHQKWVSIFPVGYVTDPDKSPVKSITIERYEGRSEACGSVTVSSWEAFKHVLAMWHEDARMHGDAPGYDGCEYTVTWENGTEYSDRFDLYINPAINKPENALARDLYTSWAYYADIYYPLHRDPRTAPASEKMAIDEYTALLNSCDLDGLNGVPAPEPQPYTYTVTHETAIGEFTLSYYLSDANSPMRMVSVCGKPSINNTPYIVQGSLYEYPDGWRYVEHTATNPYKNAVHINRVSQGGSTPSAYQKANKALQEVKRFVASNPEHWQEAEMHHYRKLTVHLFHEAAKAEAMMAEAKRHAEAIKTWVLPYLITEHHTTVHVPYTWEHTMLALALQVDADEIKVREFYTPGQNHYRVGNKVYAVETVTEDKVKETKANPPQAFKPLLTYSPREHWSLFKTLVDKYGKLDTAPVYVRREVKFVGTAKPRGEDYHVVFVADEVNVENWG